ncbi:MAG: hypothetical protein QOH20_4018 [Mycobacterium sp.]|nr:hypothetical protein [Mycobacterium sp.]
MRARSCSRSSVTWDVASGDVTITQVLIESSAVERTPPGFEHYVLLRADVLKMRGPQQFWFQPYPPRKKLRRNLRTIGPWRCHVFAGEDLRPTGDVDVIVTGLVETDDVHDRPTRSHSPMIAEAASPHHHW